ncbi:hypothetical protein [Sphingobium baderi]|uniref:hypothetical protein n=1 Tax=Sphingobium baderi TaxID=1332080 RepID=UPI000422F601|nr:hypothetical protein [Sphingobium baderi]
MSNERHLSPPTAFLCFLLKAERTKAEAGAEARRLGVRLDAAEYWWRNVHR